VLVRAYSTQTLNSQSGTFSSAALITTFSGTEGFGINNTLSAIDSGETTSPEWGVDNAQLYDVMVFELPSSGWTLDSLGLGWANTTGTDISVFLRGNDLGAGYDFSKACFTGCTTSGTGVNAIGALTSAGMGFQQVNLDNVAVGSPIDPNLNNQGDIWLFPARSSPPSATTSSRSTCSAPRRGASQRHPPRAPWRCWGWAWPA
jgi:hypothetical protein